MIIRNTPKDKYNYYIVDIETSNILETNGFNALFMDDKYLYYRKNDKITNFLKERGILGK